MKLLRVLTVASLALLFSLWTAGAQAAEQDDWAMFGRMLSLVQGFVQVSADSGAAAGSDDQQGVALAHVQHDVLERAGGRGNCGRDDELTGT